MKSSVEYYILCFISTLDVLMQRGKARRSFGSIDFSHFALMVWRSFKLVTPRRLMLANVSHAVLSRSYSYCDRAVFPCTLGFFCLCPVSGWLGIERKRCINTTGGSFQPATWWDSSIRWFTVFQPAMWRDYSIRYILRISIFKFVSFISHIKNIWILQRLLLHWITRLGEAWYTTH